MSKLNTIISKADFKQASDSNDDQSYKTYKASIKNTTGTELPFFSCPVYLQDKNGKRISETDFSASDWSNGETVEFIFETNVDFSSIKFGTPTITLEDEDYN